MTLIQDKLRALTNKFKKARTPENTRLENMKKVIEAAKKAGREVKARRE